MLRQFRDEISPKHNFGTNAVRAYTICDKISAGHNFRDKNSDKYNFWPNYRISKPLGAYTRIYPKNT